MAARTRTEAQRASDLERIAALYCRGRTQAEIGRALELSREQVAYDLKEIRSMWRESAIRDFDQARDDVLSRLDHLEATAWRAWENSLTEAERKKIEQFKDGDGSDKSRTSIEKIGQFGDARFMTIVLQTLDRRCKLLGLDAPTKIAHTDPSGAALETVAFDVKSLTTEELKAIVKVSRQQFVAAAQAATKADRTHVKGDG